MFRLNLGIIRLLNKLKKHIDVISVRLSCLIKIVVFRLIPICLFIQLTNNGMSRVKKSSCTLV
jgi:hypothetical protein